MAPPADGIVPPSIPVEQARLLSFVAHELRSALTVAAGTLSMLESGRFESLSEAQHHAVEMASRSVARVTAMASDLSLVAGIARGEWPAVPAAVSILDIIADVAHTVHGWNPVPAIDIPADASPVTVVVDRPSVARAIEALASYVVREASADTLAFGVVPEPHRTWLVVSAPGRHARAHGDEGARLDPTVAGYGFALHASAALLGLHGLRAVRFAAGPGAAAVGVAFPR